MYSRCRSTTNRIDRRSPARRTLARWHACFRPVMASIDKLAIRGVRAFSPDDKEQVIEFFFPVTMIVGRYVVPRCCGLRRGAHAAAPASSNQ